MATILHYEEIDGHKEYIVITEDDIDDDVIDGNELYGYRLADRYEIEGDLGVLPLDAVLMPKY